MELATDEKTKIEDMQRDEAAKRVEDGVEWHPRLFRPVKGGPGGSEEGEEDLDWILNANMWVILYSMGRNLLTKLCSDGSTPQKQTEQILAVTPILRGQKVNREESHTATSYAIRFTRLQPRSIYISSSATS